MQCLYVARNMTKCPLKRGVRLKEVSAYGKLKMQCLYVTRNVTKCPLKRGVRLWEVKNAVFVCN